MEKLDKSVSKIIRSSNEWEELNSYWMDKSPQQRLEAIEFLRYQYMRMLKIYPRLDKSISAIHYGK